MSTFNPAVPLSSDSPSIFPPQNQGNMTRLQTIFSTDHQFNLTAQANDGYHNLIHMTLQAPSGALASTGRSYVKVSAGRVHQFYMDDTGSQYQMTPTMPIRAAVNFNGTGPVGTLASGFIRSQYNISSVVKTAQGLYTINFATPMPDANYIVQISGMRNTTGDQSFGCIAGNPTYALSVTTTFVKIQFNGNSSTNQDALMGNVTIFSAI